MKKYESKDESEARFERELEELKKNKPSLKSGPSWEKFSSNSTDIGAKYLWLKYTLLNEDVPDDVMERMIEIIQYDIQLYEDTGRTPYGALSRKEEEEPIYALLHCAMEDPDRFWDLLQKTDKDLLSIICDDSLLKKIKIEFPHKRKLRTSELYNFFGKQLGMKKEEEGNDSVIDIVERMRSRYRTYKKNKKAEELLFG